MRTRKALSLSEITRRTGLSAAEVKRFNPALVRQVPARSTVYLPEYVEAFGSDVSFWHRPAPAAYAEVLSEFLQLRVTLEEWHDDSFRGVLRDFQRRFAATETEEGQIMATVIAYTIEETYGGRRGEILDEYASSSRIRELFERGVQEREVLLHSGAPRRSVLATLDPRAEMATPTRRLIAPPLLPILQQDDR
jgi:hypothetical protein